MNALDLAVLAIVGSSMVGGYRLGLVTGGTSCVVLLQALVLATLAVPSVVVVLGGANPTVRLIIGAFFFVGVGYGGQYVGRLVGARFRRDLPLGPYKPFDRVAGAAAAPFAVLLGLWLLVLPTLSDVSGAPSRLARHSAVARVVDALLPDPPNASQALRRLAGPAASPQVFGGLLPSLDTGPPPATSPLSAATVARVTGSTVKVEGVACRSERDGSGFSVAADLVLTNAHVVAGQEDTVVVRPDGTRLEATPVAFDPDRDLALLSVPGLDQPPLPIADGEVGTTVAVFGHPGGQPDVRVSPASIRQQVNAVGRSLYGSALVRRSVYVLAADLAPGDSGAGLVNEDGEVVGVAFAIAPDRDTTAYALTAGELRPLVENSPLLPVDTGPCLG
ncbi:MAG TPA: MarP family serine protease [Acidimicrobiales bacterium]|nr:MarP family serine protease [Acidimicrobiales bacterium]